MSFRHGGFRAVLFATCIFLAALLLTVIVPALVAASAGAYYADTARSLLGSEAAAELSRHESELAARKQLIVDVDASIARAVRNPSEEGRLGELVAARTALIEQVKALKPPVIVVPFHLNPQMLLWPAI